MMSMRNKILLLLLILLCASACKHETNHYIGTKSPSEKKDVGDIVFSDGSATPYTKELTLTDDQKKEVLAVIFYTGRACSNKNKKRTLGVGLHFLPQRCAWSLSSANGAKLCVDSIVCTAKRKGKRITFKGDVDGSDNFVQLAFFLRDSDACSGDDTSLSALYPAFDYAQKYEAFSFSEGWYLPSIAELYELFAHKSSVEDALLLCGGTSFADKWFWSSSQCSSSRLNAYDLNFIAGDWNENNKFYEEYVCVIREF